MMNEDRLQCLVKDHEFKSPAARAFLQSKGYCIYCDTDCFETRQSYWSSTIDHLLPKSKYAFLAKDENNYVVTCSSCNNMKSDLDILEHDEKLKSQIEKKGHKEALADKKLRKAIIKAIRNHLYENIQQRNRDYLDIRKIVQG